MEELAALMPEIEEQAGKLRQSSGDAARAAGDRLNTLLARAETLYREVTGRPPPAPTLPVCLHPSVNPSLRPFDSVLAGFVNRP